MLQSDQMVVLFLWCSYQLEFQFMAISSFSHFKLDFLPNLIAYFIENVSNAAYLFSVYLQQHITAGNYQPMHEITDSYLSKPAKSAGELGTTLWTKTRVFPSSFTTLRLLLNLQLFPPLVSMAVTILKPIYGRTTLLFRWSCVMTCTAISMGIANEIPSLPSLSWCLSR